MPDGVFDFVVDDGDVHQQFHVRLFDGGEYFFADDFFDDEGYGDNEVWFYFRKGVGNDFLRRGARQEVDVGAVDELVDEFECESVHVGHGEHADDLGAGVESEYFDAEFHVCPKAPVGEHDAFGAAGGPGGVVDECQLVQLVVGVFYVVGGEAVGVFFPEEFVEAFPGLGEFGFVAVA